MAQEMKPLNQGRDIKRPAPPRPAPRPLPLSPAKTSTGPISAAKKALDTELAKPLPPVPADLEGKKTWLMAAKARETVLEKHVSVLKNAWFAGKLPFEGYTAYSSKIWDWQAPIHRVQWELAPKPAPGPVKPGDGKCPDYLTPGLVDYMGKHPNSPLNVGGLIALPITLLLDGFTGLSKLTGGCSAPETKPEAKK